MSPSSPTILFAREVPWETTYPISTRILAEHFARDGWNVIWLTPPLRPWHFKSQRLERQQAISQYRQRGVFFDGVFAYTPWTPVPFSRRFYLDRPALARLSWRMCMPPIRGVLRRRGVPMPDALWLGTLDAGGLMDLFPGVPTIFHVTDAFRYYASAPSTTVQLERANYRVADHLVVTAPALQRLVMEDFSIPESKISVIMHGVDLDRFAHLDRQPDPLPDCPHPRLVALGNTSKLDFEILSQLAGHPDVGSVVVIGPRTERLSSLAANLPALKVVGSLPPEQVPRYLHYSDVGLVLFGQHMSQVADYVCPMKLFEYAAARLPVVSTPLPVYQDLGAPVLQVTTPEDALEAVRQALRETDKLGRAMWEFAEKNAWARQYEAALHVVEDLLRKDCVPEPASPTSNNF